MTTFAQFAIDHNVTVKSTYIGIDHTAPGFGAPVFHWKCVLRCDGRKLTIDYRAGMAHQVNGEPTPPTVANLLYCLQSDASAGQYTFDEFCGMYDYSTDSRSAERTHKACSKANRDVARLFGDHADAFMDCTETEEG